jgi:hypothetical protein
MDPRRIYIVTWLCTPNGVDLGDDPVVGALVNVHLVADDLSDAIQKSSALVAESGWLADPRPKGFCLHFEDELDDFEFVEIREMLQEALEIGPVFMCHCFEKDDPLYNKECENYIWLLDWYADNESDPEVEHIDDASAIMAVFLKCEGLPEVVNEGYEWISSMGWTPDDEPRWAEQLAYSDIDDRVNPQYQICALEAFRDGNSIYIQSYPRADGYPDRVFPLCEPDDLDSE